LRDIVSPSEKNAVPRYWLTKDHLDVPFLGGFSYAQKGGGRFVSTMRIKGLQDIKKENRGDAESPAQGHDQFIR
jgi:hypothetical protein